jgi:hypothetical protein
VQQTQVLPQLVRGVEGEGSCVCVGGGGSYKRRLLTQGGMGCCNLLLFEWWAGSCCGFSKKLKWGPFWVGKGWGWGDRGCCQVCLGAELLSRVGPLSGRPVVEWGSMHMAT